MKKLTIKDIANHFNVSISTVSKALNDSYEISVRTKEKIQQFAKEHNYQPNFNALSLKNQKTKTIGIIIPNMLDYFFAQVFKGAEKVADERGYKIISCISNESYDKETKTIEALSNGTIDGFLLSMAEETEMKNTYAHFNNTIENGIPIVMFDRVTDQISCDKIITNDFDGAVSAVRHLSKTGYRKIAFISTISHLNIGRLRHQGYIKGIENEGIELNPDHIINIKEDDYKEYENVLTPIFDRLDIDSVITTDESSAIAAMKVAKRKGHKIPENFSVIAFSNGILARHSSPKLTTVSQHGEQMGVTAATLLIDKLESKNLTKEPQTVVIKTDIVERKSTKPA